MKFYIVASKTKIISAGQSGALITCKSKMPIIFITNISTDYSFPSHLYQIIGIIWVSAVIHNNYLYWIISILGQTFKTTPEHFRPGSFSFIYLTVMANYY